MARLALLFLFFLCIGCAKDIDEKNLSLSEKSKISDLVKVTVRPMSIINTNKIRVQVTIETTQALNFLDQNLVDISFITLNDDSVIAPESKIEIERTTYQSKTDLIFVVDENEPFSLDELTQLEFAIFTPTETTFSWSFSKTK